MHFRNLLRIASSAALTVAVCASIALPANADPGKDGVETAPFQNPKGQHCVAQLARSAESPEGFISQERCYGSFREAVADATNGRISDAPEDPATAAKDPKFKARVNDAATPSSERVAGAGGTVLYLAWQLIGYEGESYLLEYDTRCDSIPFNADLTGTWWDNRISAATAYSGCQAIHYQFRYSGLEFWAVDVSDFSVWDFDNRTTSIQLIG